MDQKSFEQTRWEHAGKVSDKWALYVTEYERILSQYRDRRINLLEIGVQNGGSLEIWTKYFPQAQKLIGCDIDPKCGLLQYEDPRVAVVVGDANTDAVQDEILGHAGTLDIVIDDGSHRSDDIVRSFCRYFPHLADGGIFLAEDLHCSYWREFGGGLLYRYSAMEFFKMLPDVVNHEHWGIKESRHELLEPFLSKYGTNIDEECLQHIHSIEFVNSICVIRKAAPHNNRLGRRAISGSEGQVVAAHQTLSESECQPIIQKSWPLRWR